MFNWLRNIFVDDFDKWLSNQGILITRDNRQEIEELKDAIEEGVLILKVDYNDR